MSFSYKMCNGLSKVFLVVSCGLLTYCDNTSLPENTTPHQNSLIQNAEKSPASKEEACEITVYTPGMADHFIETKQGLVNLLTSPNSTLMDNDIVYLKDNTTFLFNDGLVNDIKKSIKLVSGGAENGALLLGNNTTNVLFRILAPNVTFSGLRIHGDFSPTSENSFGIKVITGPIGSQGNFIADGFVLENSELAGWTYAGVLIKNATNCKISKNNIHDNIKSGLGYGISLELAAEALITCNDFDRNRHDIAGDGKPNQSYEASYNTVRNEGIANMHRFDMHGESIAPGQEGINAGERILIHHNDFLGQNNDGLAVVIRGIPGDIAQIYENNFAFYECTRFAVRQKVQNTINSLANLENMIVTNNTAGLRPTPSNYVNLNDDFIILNENNRLMRYTFGDYCDCSTDLAEVGNLAPNYQGFFVGDWTDSTTDDLIALASNNRMYLLPYNNNTFYGQGGGVDTGINFENYVRFFVGDWIGDEGDELLGFRDDNRMLLFTFDGSQLSNNPIDVGAYPAGYKDFFIGNWSDDSKKDLIGLTDDGRMFLWPFRFGKFRGSGVQVASGLNAYSKFFVGNWSNTSFDELLALKIDNPVKPDKPNNEVFLFTMNTSGTFAQPESKGVNYTNTKEFLVMDYDQNGSDDLITIDNSNTVTANKYTGYFHNGNKSFVGCVEEYQVFLDGEWRE